MSVMTDNGRYYIHPSRRKSVPSITNIKDIKSIPALKYAAARDAASYAADQRAKLATLEREEAFQLVRSAPFRRTPDSPSAIGDIVHNWIDRFIKKEPVPPEEVSAAPVTARHTWEQFGRFVNRYAPEFTGSEFTVWSDVHDYAGTGDFSCRIGGGLVLVDTKTGKQAWPDMAIQLAALANADCILTPDGEENEMPAWDAYGVLHLRPASFALIPVYHIDAAFRAFLGLKAVFDWQVEFGDKTLGYAPRFGTRE